MNSAAKQSGQQPPTPWWRLPIMWLVLGGPALVVVAGIGTAVRAFHGADVPLATGTHTEVKASTPATQGRNHVNASTPR